MMIPREIQGIPPFLEPKEYQVKRSDMQLDARTTESETDA
jgi:hypothetical protein